MGAKMGNMTTFVLTVIVVFFFEYTISKNCLKENCAFTDQYDPRCSSRNQTYGNEVEFYCTKVEPGCREEDETLACRSKCPCPQCGRPDCFCTMEYKPVCSSTGITYPNRCTFECTEIKTGCRDQDETIKCEQKCPCPP